MAASTPMFVCEQHPHGQPGPPATRSLSPLCHRASHGCCPCHTHARTARGDVAQIPPLSTAHPAAGSAYLGRKDSKNPRCESSAGASLCQPFTQSKKRCFLCQPAELPPLPCLFPGAFTASSLCVSPRGQEGRDNSRQGGHAPVLDQAARPPPLHPAGHPSGTSGAQHPGPGQAARGRMPTAQACTAPREPSVRTRGKVCSFFRATQLRVPEHKPCALSVPARERKAAVQKQPGCSVPRLCSQTSAVENCSFQEGQALPAAQRWSSAAVLQN